MPKKQKTFADELQAQLAKPMYDANGNRVQVDGKNATVMQALAKATINKAFKDPRIAISLIEKFAAKDEGTTKQLDNFIQDLM